MGMFVFVCRRNVELRDQSSRGSVLKRTKNGKQDVRCVTLVRGIIDSYILSKIWRS